MYAIPAARRSRPGPVSEKNPKGARPAASSSPLTMRFGGVASRVRLPPSSAANATGMSSSDGLSRARRAMPVATGSMTATVPVELRKADSAAVAPIRSRTMRCQDVPAVFCRYAPKVSASPVRKMAPPTTKRAAMMITDWSAKPASASWGVRRPGTARARRARSAVVSSRIFSVANSSSAATMTQPTQMSSAVTRTPRCFPFPQERGNGEARDEQQRGGSQELPADAQAFEREYPRHGCACQYAHDRAGHAPDERGSGETPERHAEAAGEVVEQITGQGHEPEGEDRLERVLPEPLLDAFGPFGPGSGDEGGQPVRDRRRSRAGQQRVDGAGERAEQETGKYGQDGGGQQRERPHCVEEHEPEAGERAVLQVAEQVLHLVGEADAVERRHQPDQADDDEPAAEDGQAAPAGQLRGQAPHVQAPAAVSVISAPLGGSPNSRKALPPRRNSSRKRSCSPDGSFQPLLPGASTSSPSGSAKPAAARVTERVTPLIVTLTVLPSGNSASPVMVVLMFPKPST